MNFIITLLILIIILGIIVFIHELGHFIASKRVGVYVHEFALGMGPKIFSFKRKNDETTYSLRLLPLGGFNALAMNEKDFNVSKNKVLNNRKYWEKLLILIMGVVFNFILTIVLLFINGLIYGSPDISPIIGIVKEESPAYIAGLKTDDKVIKINDKKVSSWDDALLELNFIQKDKTEFKFTIERNNKKLDLNIKPEKIKDKKGEKQNFFGFGIAEKKKYGYVNAVKYSFEGFAEMFSSLFKVLGNLFNGKIGADNLSGPVGIFKLIDQVKEGGKEALIYLTAYLSVNVGIINLLPMPIFDGGRILIITIEKILNKKLSPKVESIIDGIGIVLLVLLFLFVMYNDILKL